ncbi:MAG: hypothetical protein VB914_05680 [Porticoccaceae bacterium]|jgi:hypothetical protein
MSGRILPNGLESLKPLIIKVMVVLVPSYTVAYLTEAMVYTVPMLAAASIVATNLYTSPQINRRVDDEGTSEDAQDHEGDTENDSSGGFTGLS